MLGSYPVPIWDSSPVPPGATSSVAETRSPGPGTSMGMDPKSLLPQRCHFLLAECPPPQVSLLHTCAPQLCPHLDADDLARTGLGSRDSDTVRDTAAHSHHHTRLAPLCTVSVQLGTAGDMGQLPAPCIHAILSGPAPAIAHSITFRLLIKSP